MGDQRLGPSIKLASGYSVVPFQEHQSLELVYLWRKIFEQAVGVIDPNPIEEQRDYLLKTVVVENHTLVVQYHQELVGFIAASANCIAQLYLAKRHQGNGIGTALVAWAKSQSNGSLYLYTFESNSAAQQFYLRQGFVEVQRGFEEQWQLPDIRYEWRRDSH